jgi:hypothetical protein
MDMRNRKLRILQKKKLVSTVLFALMTIRAYVPKDVRGFSTKQNNCTLLFRHKKT